MAEFTNDYPGAQNAFDDFQDFSSSLDFSSFHSPCDLVAPPPDIFEFDIDLGLEGFDDQLQVFTVDQNFSIPRGSYGPLSTITTSGVSESAASDELFSDISSLYGNGTSPSTTYSNPSNDLLFAQFEKDLENFQITTALGSEYDDPQSKLLDDSDPTSFGRLPPTPPRSPVILEKSVESEYGSPRRSMDADYLKPLEFNFTQGTVSPSHLNSELPPIPSPPNSAMAVEDNSKDPQRKYRCQHCPRGFARAYNLKTHMATHDPNRLKPHVCHHRNCGRSFSRKHDLSRHLVSIHKTESKSPSVGVATGARSWCDDCGKGTVGREASCECADVK